MIALGAFVRESNAIEGITRLPTSGELFAHDWLLGLPTIVTEDLERFVEAVAPGAKLRDKPGMDVRVGGHFPPHGGRSVIVELGSLLARCVKGRVDPWKAHVEYETLHPFMDGNGRSGRALWLWMMLDRGQYRMADYGFLRAFYYQTLQESRP